MSDNTCRRLRHEADSIEGGYGFCESPAFLRETADEVERLQQQIRDLETFIAGVEMGCESLRKELVKAMGDMEKMKVVFEHGLAINREMNRRALSLYERRNQ